MKAKKQPSKTESQTKILVRKSADFKSIYANWVQGSMTPYDISLVVGEGFLSEDGTFNVDQKARVIFSPLEAKMLLPVLLNTLKNFEANFGAIAVPEGLLEQIVSQAPGQAIENLELVKDLENTEAG